MKYVFFKMDFPNGAHFGNGFLNDTNEFVHADQIFSGMFIEALKCDKQQELLDGVKNGQIVLSDAFPYKEDTFFLPKPMLKIDHEESTDSSISKKWFKNLKYIPADQLQDFISGNMRPGSVKTDFGKVDRRVNVNVRTGSDPEPYHVGVYHFYPKCGLYIIVGVKDESQENLVEELLSSLSFSGIGGGKSRGLGRFEVRKAVHTEELEELLEKQSDKNMLLSGALPTEDEMDNALIDASYLLEKRSGFVASSDYAEEQQKKKDLYVFVAGSCFVHSFSGAVYDVSNGGRHPVYRYAKGMFIGL